MRIGIIILNWNGYNDTVECIDSLLKNSYKELDIILVDNNSKNNEGKKLKKLFKSSIHLIENSKNLGFTGGCNIGIKKSLELGNNYVMLLNNDAVVKNNFIETLLHSLSKNKNIGIIGPIITYYKSKEIWFGGGKINYLIGGPTHMLKGEHISSIKKHETYEVDYVSGCCMLIKKEVIDAIGLLDDKYFAYNEEVDFCFKAKSIGYSSYIDSKCHIEHKKSASVGNVGSNTLSEIQAYLMARNGVYFGKKNLLGIKKYWYLIAQYTILPILRLVFQIRKWSVLKAYIKGLLGGKKEIN